MINEVDGTDKANDSPVFDEAEVKLKSEKALKVKNQTMKSTMINTPNDKLSSENKLSSDTDTNPDSSIIQNNYYQRLLSGWGGTQQERESSTVVKKEAEANIEGEVEDASESKKQSTVKNIDATSEVTTEGMANVNNTTRTRPENCSKGIMINNCLFDNDNDDTKVRQFQTDSKPEKDSKIVISDCFEHKKMPDFDITYKKKVCTKN